MSEELKQRFKMAAVKLIKDLEFIDFKHPAFEQKRQLFRCAPAVAANYRAACRAKSKADFIYKLSLVEEECDETLFWLEFLDETGVEVANTEDHQKEFNEILSIVIASIKSARK